MNPRQDPRVAGQVLRWHTWPHIQHQTVADHTWQVLRILLAIWPSVPRHVILHTQVHDIGEIITGDPPYPVKKDNPVFKAESDRIENDGHLAMVMPWSLTPPQTLSELEKKIFKLAEFIEMGEDGIQERMLGSRFADPVIDRCTKAIDQHVKWLESQIIEPGVDEECEPDEDEKKANALVRGILVETTRYMRRRRGEWVVV